MREDWELFEDIVKALEDAICYLDTVKDDLGAIYLFEVDVLDIPLKPFTSSC